jgi:energy-converting hydrogenase Eha subunit H
MSVLEKLVEIIPYIETGLGLIAFIVLVAFTALIFIKKKSNKNMSNVFGFGNNVENNQKIINDRKENK